MLHTSTNTVVAEAARLKDVQDLQVGGFVPGK